VKNKKFQEQARREGMKKFLLKGRKPLILPGIIIFLVILLPLIWFLSKDKANSEGVYGSKIGEKVNYRNQFIAMTTVEAKTGSDYTEIPLETIKEKKMVYFEYVKAGKRVPLMAYITPEGKLVTAVSMCEPCRSTKFHIENEEIVCNACGTRWSMEGLKGISGGCLNYPPDAIVHAIENGQVKIQNSLIINWRPRI